MKDFKKLLALLLVGVLLLGTTGCIIIGPEESESKAEEEESQTDETHVFDWSSYKGYSQTLNISSEKYQNYDLDDFDYEDYQAKADALMESAENGDSLEIFEPLYDAWEEALYDMLSHISIAHARYYVSGSDSDEEVYLALYDYQLAYISWYGSFIKVMAKAPQELKDFFFGEFATDEEIEDYVKRNSYDDETSEWQKEMEELSNDGLELNNDYSNGKIDDDELKSKALDIVIQTAELGDKLAQKLNYDNYLEYIYHEGYSRDYGPDDLGDVFDAVKTYLLPLAKKGCVVNPRSWITDRDSDQYAYYYGTYMSAFTYKRAYYGGYLSNFAKVMGGDYLDAYNHVFEDGYYVFTNNSKSLGTAYSTTLYAEEDGLVFFSSGYQNISNVVHELGHFIAGYNNEYVDNYSFDICETHSTANELLFWIYLDTVVDEEDKNDCGDVFHYNLYNYVYNDISMIAVTTCVAEIENYVFGNYTKLTKDELLAGIDAIVDSYEGVVSDTYWAYPLPICPGYYISYAAGMMNALQFACQALDDFDTARDNYLAFCAYTFDEDAGEEFNMEDQLAAGHLYSPFSSEAIQYVSENIYAKVDK